MKLNNMGTIYYISVNKILCTYLLISYLTSCSVILTNCLYKKCTYCIYTAAVVHNDMCRDKSGGYFNKNPRAICLSV